MKQQSYDGGKAGGTVSEVRESDGEREEQRGSEAASLMMERGRGMMAVLWLGREGGRECDRGRESRDGSRQ